jgi:membrane protein
VIQEVRELYRRLMPDEVDQPALKPVIAVARWAIVFYMQLARDQAFVRAGAMAYQTLTALVPLLLLVFGILGLTEIGPGMSWRQHFESLIFETFIADIQPVRQFLIEGIGRLDLATLGIIGVAGLVVFAGQLFLTVEQTYNHIFGSRVQRRWGLRLLSFYFTLTVVPVLITVLFVGMLEVAGQWGVASTARSLLEPLLTFIVLLSALKLFPTAQVRWGPAFLGASISTVGLWGARYVFRLYLEWFKADDPLIVVYGSVGLIPVFLLWLYLLWVIVLLGVEVAYVAQNFHSLWEVERAWLEQRKDGVRGPRLHTALELLAWVGWTFREGTGPARSEDLARRLGLHLREVEPVLDLLVQRGFLVGGDGAYSLARPAERIRIPDIVHAWREGASLRRDEAAPSRVELEVAEALSRGLPPTLADAIDPWVQADVDAEEGGLFALRS